MMGVCCTDLNFLKSGWGAGGEGGLYDNYIMGLWASGLLKTYGTGDEVQSGSSPFSTSGTRRGSEQSIAAAFYLSPLVMFCFS